MLNARSIATISAFVFGLNKIRIRYIRHIVYMYCSI